MTTTTTNGMSLDTIDCLLQMELTKLDLFEDQGDICFIDKEIDGVIVISSKQKYINYLCKIHTDRVKQICNEALVAFCFINGITDIQQYELNQS